MNELILDQFETADEHVAIDKDNNICYEEAIAYITDYTSRRNDIWLNAIEKYLEDTKNMIHSGFFVSYLNYVLNYGYEKKLRDSIGENVKKYYLSHCRYDIETEIVIEGLKFEQGIRAYQTIKEIVDNYCSFSRTNFVHLYNDIIFHEVYHSEIFCLLKDPLSYPTGLICPRYNQLKEKDIQLDLYYSLQNKYDDVKKEVKICNSNKRMDIVVEDFCLELKAKEAKTKDIYQVYDYYRLTNLNPVLIAKDFDKETKDLAKSLNVSLIKYIPLYEILDSNEKNSFYLIKKESLKDNNTIPSYLNYDAVYSSDKNFDIFFDSLKCDFETLFTGQTYFFNDVKDYGLV